MGRGKHADGRKHRARRNPRGNPDAVRTSACYMRSHPFPLIPTNWVKALYRSFGIACKGTQVYGPRYREQWQNKFPHTGCFAAQNSTVNSRMDCRLCGTRCEENSWPRAGSSSP